MQELPQQRSAGFKNRAIYLTMCLSPVIGLILCGNAIAFALWEISTKLHIPDAYSLSVSGSSTGQLTPDDDLSNTKQLSFRGRSVELNSELSGDIKTSFLSNRHSDLNNYDKPGRPWLCISLFFMGYAILLQLWKLYEVFRRNCAAINLTATSAKAMSIGAILCFAGSGHEFATFLLLSSLPYAGIGYLAYTRWERVKSQLYKG